MNKKLYDLMDWAGIEGIVYSEEDHPEKLLGAHKVKGGFLVQTFQPGARKVFLRHRNAKKSIPMEMADDAGFFAVLLTDKKLAPYYFEVVYENGDSQNVEDPYLYTDLLGNNELNRFTSGIHYSIYDYLE